MSLSTNAKQQCDDNISVKIYSGQTVSTVLNTNGFQLLGLFMPSTWTAATIKFQVSKNNTDWYDLTDLSVTPIDLAVSASQAVPLDANTFAAWHLIRIVSSVAQSADRMIGFSAGPVLTQN